MAESISLSDAAAALRDYFGDQLEARQEAGREMMADALKERFGISQAEANTLVRELEQARTIRWQNAPPSARPVFAAPDSGEGMPLGREGGYWQL